MRARGTKLQGALLEGKAQRRVDDDDNGGNDGDDDDARGEYVAPMEDLQTHLRFGLRRPRTPYLERVKIGIVGVPDALQQTLNALVHGVPRDRLTVRACNPHRPTWHERRPP